MIKPLPRYSRFWKISQILTLNASQGAILRAIHFKFLSVIVKTMNKISCNRHRYSLIPSHFMASQSRLTQKTLFLAYFWWFFGSGVQSLFHSHFIFLLKNAITFSCLRYKGQLNTTFLRVGITV